MLKLKTFISSGVITVCAPSTNRTEKSMDYINALCNADTRFGVSFFDLTTPQNPVWIIISQATLMRLSFYTWNFFASRRLLAPGLKLLDRYCEDHSHGRLNFEQKKDVKREGNEERVSAFQSQSRTQNLPVNGVTEEQVVKRFGCLFRLEFLLLILIKSSFSLFIISFSLYFSIIYLSNLPNNARYVCQGPGIQYNCIYHALNLVKPVFVIIITLTGLSGIKLTWFWIQKGKDILTATVWRCKMEKERGPRSENIEDSAIKEDSMEGGSANKPDSAKEKVSVTVWCCKLKCRCTCCKKEKEEVPVKDLISIPSMKSMVHCFNTSNQKTPWGTLIFLRDYAQLDHVDQDECKCVSTT